jgi:hypothetical protein
VSMTSPLENLSFTYLNRSKSRFIQARFTLVPDIFRSGAKNHLYRMYNFQKLSETTSLRCNNSSENSIPKRYGKVFFHVATESYPIQWKRSLRLGIDPRARQLNTMDKCAIVEIPKFCINHIIILNPHNDIKLTA